MKMLTFKITLTGNLTLLNPTSLTAGTSAGVFLIQDGTVYRTATFGNSFDFIGVLHRHYQIQQVQWTDLTI